jgi:hemolysin activation/secretion protein
MFEYSQGMKILGGEMNYGKFTYYGEAHADLFKRFGASLKLRGQLGLDSLPSSENFSAGGMNTVRGYGEGMLTAKDGISANAEIRYNAGFIKWKYIDFVKFFGFFDYGAVFPESSMNLPDDYGKIIYSTGFGIKIGILKHIDANIVWAAPLQDHEYYDVPGSKVLFMVQGRIG